MTASSRRPLPVRAVAEDGQHRLDRRTWPATLPAVRQLLDDGLEPGPLTVLVGENGSGKSTIVEAVAMAYGLSPEGGSTGARHSTWASESGLHTHLRLTRGAGAARWGYFVRAETMHGLFTYLDQNSAPTGAHEAEFHALSHGESFLALLATRRFATPGLFVLDEPEAGLSFTAQLTLIGQLLGIVADGRSQVVMATHSPVLAGTPGATLLQLDDDGLHPTTWPDLAVVDHHRRFLDDPQRSLRHLRT